MNAALRFWSKVNFPSDLSECWEWTAARYRKGYGMVWWEGVTYRAHRTAYELLVGPIPEYLTVDHLCFNKQCVNPGHFELVTAEENSRRGARYGNALRDETRCRRGHEFTPESTYIRPSGGFRSCHICKIEYDRARHAKARAQRRAENGS
jgi:hypothetical protein